MEPKIETNNPLEQVDINTEIAKPEDWQDYKKIRLEALDKDPTAFGETKEKALAKEDNVWQSDLESSPDKFIYLVKNKKELLGMGGADKRDKFGEDTWFVFGMYVSALVRGKGVGGKLLNSIEAEAKSRGAKKIVLFVSPEQSPAVGLYEKLGFKSNHEKNSASPDGRVWMYMEKDC